MCGGNLEANFPSSSYQILHAEGPRNFGRGDGGPEGAPPRWRSASVQGPHMSEKYINFLLSLCK